MARQAGTAGGGVRLFGALFAIVASAVQIYAFHWGALTPDSIVQYGQAVSGRYDDWHPPVTAWLWRQLLKIPAGQHGGAPMLILNSLLYWGALLIIANVLTRRSGWPASALILALGLLPIPFGEVGAILKDPLLACLLAMATALIIARNAGGSIALALAALPLIVVAAATRFNAVFAAAPLILLLLPERWTRGVWRTAALGVTAAAVLAAGSWAINVAISSRTARSPSSSSSISTWPASSRMAATMAIRCSATAWRSASPRIATPPASMARATTRPARSRRIRSRSSSGARGRARGGERERGVDQRDPRFTAGLSAPSRSASEP